MNNTYLLRCWSSNENWNGDFDMALVRVDDKLREKAWKLRKLCDQFIRGMHTNDPVHISFEVSFFSYEPVFLKAPDEEEEGELFAAYEELWVQDSSQLYSLDEEELEALEKQALHEEGTRIRVDRDGLYWTTYPKHTDVTITTASLSWQELGIG